MGLLSEREESILHRYFDGELAGEEAAELRRLLPARADLRAELERISEIRSLLRESVEKDTKGLDSDDLFARIEARIDRDADGTELERGAAPRFVADPRLVASPRLVAGQRSVAIEGGARESSATRTTVRKRRVAAVVFATVAIAAAILLFVNRPAQAPVVHDDSLAMNPHGEAETPESSVATVETVFQTEVIEVDFGENSGAIFAIEGEHGERHAVVWLADPIGSVVE